MTPVPPGSPALRPAAEATVRRYAEAWLAGDLEQLLSCYAEDFTIHYFGHSRFAGTHVGRDAASTVLAEVSSVATRELLAIDDVLASDAGATLIVRERLTRDGESHDRRRVLRYRVAGEQLIECWLYDEDQRLVDHLWRDAGD